MLTTTARFDLVPAGQATFRVLLAALARPGRHGRLPELDPGCPLPAARAASAILLTLLDHEVSFAVVPADGDTEPAHRLVRYLRAVTGSRPAPVDRADYVLTLGERPAALLRGLRCGSPAFPDESATLLCLVPTLAVEAGPLVRLAGPGVADATPRHLPGLTAADLALLAELNGAPPLGVDLVLVDASGALIGLPRSTRVTPLAAPGTIHSAR